MVVTRAEPSGSTLPNCYPNSFGRPLMETGEYFDWSPAVDISETGQEYLIRAALPAVKIEDLKITCQDGVLTLNGERHAKEEHRKWLKVENCYRSFSSQFALPDAIDAAAITAESKDGLLTIHVPKASQARASSLAAIKVQ